MQHLHMILAAPGACNRHRLTCVPWADPHPLSGPMWIQCGSNMGAGVYRPKGTEYKFEGKTLVSSSGAFQRVDCDMILENP